MPKGGQINGVLLGLAIIAMVMVLGASAAFAGADTTFNTALTKFTDFLDWVNGIPIEEVFFVPDASVKFERYSLEEYVHLTTTKGPVGPVPVLYADLLHGRASR